MTPSDEMVEAVAKAGYEYSAEGIDPQLVVSWDERQEHAKETARQKARAQIAAMKDSDVYKAGFAAGQASSSDDMSRLKDAFLTIASAPYHLGYSHPFMPHPLSMGSLEELGIPDLFEDDYGRLIDIAQADIELAAAAREKGGQG